MLLGVSMVSVITAGTVGYFSASDSLRANVFAQLTTIRETRAAEITRFLESVRSDVMIGSSNESAVGASNSFNSAFDRLEAQSLPPTLQQSVDQFYRDDFVPQLSKRTGLDYSTAAFTPRNNAATYLQGFYTAPHHLDYDEAAKVDDAQDGSSWSEVNARYNSYFRTFTAHLGFDDALLLDTHGNVVYSVYKGVDLGANLKTGPYQDSALTSAYEQILRSNTLGDATLTDFDRYLPSLNAPTMWALSPVGADGQITGVLAFQISLDSINTVMTGGQAWEKQGLGATGEVYLAGPDRTMRSTSRALLEHPRDYAQRALEAGTPPDVVAKMSKYEGTILLQPVRSAAVANAFEGKTGTIVARDYLGTESLSAYAPVHIPGLNWVIVAHEDMNEAFAPVVTLTRDLALSIVGLVLLVCLASLLLAQLFLRPLRRLVRAVKRIAAGEIGVQVNTGSRDEIADVGESFNEMSRSLQVKADLLDAEQKEHERLLLTLMPEGLAKRYRQGDETIAEDHHDVTVLFADILGFDDYARDRSSAETLASLNDIVKAFEEEAERWGIEQVRTTRQDGFLASCGLVVPRVDSARRTVEFAMEMTRIVDHFNTQHHTELGLRAGIDTGTVTSGLVGRTSVVYDMWGDAVNLAHRVQGSADAPGIYVTERVVEALPAYVSFTETAVVGGGPDEQRVWCVDIEAQHA
ncbi:HAMP domain-containing protein [Leifsonia sp. ZF2019]|uniref:adenylate/guanylate cyclase domain-containing protein n=1 Tax=Leifsonia sp. ZF2019 TaxID=2781978 RepID=UPI001CBB9A81|nr:adenylate/guanylate cyclase domain-containing protein [Leifsonia sp. ZF2019]UAJ80118.1 HAMP domain-containing protein [Leifsonia sp. ZF2019]